MSDSQFKDMHWTQVRKLVEQNGGEWVNVESGIEFLEARLQSQEPASTEETGLTMSDTVEGPDENAQAMAGSAVLDAPLSGPAGPLSGPAGDIPVFDNNLPYGEVFGTCNARFLQNGHHFGPGGEFIKPEDVK